MAVFAAALLTACPPEAEQGATTQQSSITPVISYCGVDGITSLTLVMGETPQQLTSDLAASWSSSDPTTADVDAAGAITLTKATAPNTPVLITAASSGAAASFELSVAAAGTVPSILVKTEADLRLIDCADGVFRLNADYTLANDITLTKEWDPIGDSGKNPFTGTLDGAGHTVRNLFIDQPSTPGTSSGIGLGLVARNRGGTIKDIGVELGAAGIKGSVTIGGIAGNNDGGTVSGVVSGAGSISGNRPGGIGGLVGSNNSTGTVIGISLVDVNGLQVGGLVGYNFGTVKGYATGNVNNGTQIGGLTGEDFEGTIVGYYAEGTVQGILGVGGMSGGSPKSVTGYSRGKIVASTSSNVGRVIADDSSLTTDNTFYSSRAGESTVTGATATNSVGTSIDASTKTALSDFTNFDANDWEYFAGKWPAIKFPADQSIFNKYRGALQPIEP